MPFFPFFQSVYCPSPIKSALAAKAVPKFPLDPSAEGSRRNLHLNHFLRALAIRYTDTPYKSKLILSLRITFTIMIMIDGNSNKTSGDKAGLNEQGSASRIGQGGQISSTTQAMSASRRRRQKWLA